MRKDLLDGLARAEATAALCRRLLGECPGLAPDVAERLCGDALAAADGLACVLERLQAAAGHLRHRRAAR